MATPTFVTHVLLVDDDPDDCRFFEEALAAVAPQVSLRSLPEGDGLLEEVEEWRPSLIVMDYNLPRENGIELLALLQAHPVFRAIPVVMWSTGHLPAIVAAAYAAGIRYFFAKPWKLEVLQEQLSVLPGLIYSPATYTC
ncbi:response regulator [Paraflavisolibacter sp. H34]|uniref:response regulator n=1 Tax=Huijunlia imazamoxiresistens TaxID=3127457 RepID=UPI0030158F5E